MADTAIEWANVPGWSDVKCTRDGQIMGPSGIVLKHYIDPKTGHRHVLIRNKKLRVHHAVLLTYIGPRPAPPAHLVRHLNDDPSDNRDVNLAWGTSLDNANDQRRNRGYTCGEQRSNHRLTTADVAAIRLDQRASRVVGAEYGVSHTAIQRIRRGERWAAA